MKYWFKFSVLTLALTATVSSIYLLKQGHMTAFWTSLGFKSSGQVLDWCQERVASVYFYDSKQKLFEEKNKWIWKDTASTGSPDESQQVLNYLEIEKWFAKYCYVDIEETDMVTGASKPLFEVEFIDGARVTFQEIDEVHFKLQGKIYKSSILREAFKELLAFGPKMK